MTKRSSCFHVLSCTSLNMPLFPDGAFTFFTSVHPLTTHSHSYYELTIIKDGEVTWELDSGEKLHVKRGQFAITQPHVLHKGELEGIRPCRLFYAWIDPTATDALRYTPFTEQVLESLDNVLRNAGNCVLNGNNEMLDLYSETEVFVNVHERIKGQNDPVKSGVTVSLIRLGLLRLVMNVCEAISGNTLSIVSPAIAKSAAYIEKNCREKVPISKAAEITGLGKSRYFERFKLETGLSPHEYLIRHRCSCARQLLAEKKLSITNIAFDLCFSSSQHFASSFRKYTGMSPTQYRKKHAANIN